MAITQVKRYHFNIADSPGLTPQLYPYGQTTYKTGMGVDYLTDEGNGNYVITIDPINDVNTYHLIARFYDLWYSGSKQGSKIDLGYWWLRILLNMTTEEQAYLFSDFSAQGIPTQIPNIIMPCDPNCPEPHRIHIKTYSATGFTLEFDKIGSSTPPINNIEVLCRGGKYAPT